MPPQEYAIAVVEYMATLWHELKKEFEKQSEDSIVTGRHRLFRSYW